MNPRLLKPLAAVSVLAVSVLMIGVAVAVLVLTRALGLRGAA